VTRVITAADSGYTYPGSVDLAVKTCPSCGITYAIPEGLDKTARKYNRADWPNDTLSWYCPNGHSLSYAGKSEEQRLRERLREERERAGRLAAQRDQAEASRKSHKAAAKRARNERDRQAKRAKAGVCPCCIKQLARHMASQHPEYEPGAEHG
jgi:hypothetical protein